MTEARGTRPELVSSAWRFQILKAGLIAAVLAGVPAPAVGEPVSTLTESAAQFEPLQNPDADKAVPVDFQATVTYVRSYERALFVQDGDSAIYVDWAVNNLLLPGDRVEIKGKTKASFKPVVVAESVTLLHHGPLPVAIGATFDQLIRSDLDCRYVTVYGVVRDAVSVVSSGIHSTLLQLHTDGGELDAEIDVDNPGILAGLLDAEVLVTGAASGRFDGKMQQTGIALHVSNFDGVKILKHAATDPWTLPITPMGEIVAGYHVSDQSKRIRVHGTLTYYQPGASAVLQEGEKSLWLSTSSMAPVHVGDVVDATGFPDLQNGVLALANAEIQDRGTTQPVTPKLLTWDELASSRNLFDLVSINATVVAEVRGAARDEYVLEASGNLFSAIYKHPMSEKRGNRFRS